MYMSANFQVISDPVVFQNAQVTIYRAQKVVTMNPQMPWAECVAVAGGTIIAVGDFIDMEAYFKAHAAYYHGSIRQLPHRHTALNRAVVLGQLGWLPPQWFGP